MADQCSEHGASTMPMMATRNVLVSPTMKSAEVSVFWTVGEPGVVDRHPGLAAEKCKAG